MTEISSSTDTVITERHDRVLLVTLNDAKRRNVVTQEMNEAVVSIVDQVEKDDSFGAIVLTGNGPAFCAGGHLDDLLNAENPQQLANIYSGFLAMANTSVPTVAAINGAAVGAGMNFALACDLVIAAESARFDSRFHQIAIHSGGGHLWRLRNQTNETTARAMVLFGEQLSGAQAEKAGLAWRCVADDQLLEVAIGYAQTAAKAPKGLVARTKATFSGLDEITSAKQAVAAELAPQFWAMQQPEFSEFVSDLQQRISARRSRK